MKGSGGRSRRQPSKPTARDSTQEPTRRVGGVESDDPDWGMEGPYNGLHRLLPFLAALEKPGYSAGRMVIQEGHWPYYEPSKHHRQFFMALYKQGVVYEFAWPEWQNEALRLYQDPEALASADAPALRKLLTLHARKDRYCEGHLAAMIEEGHIAAILRRIKELAAGGLPAR